MPVPPSMAEGGEMPLGAECDPTLPSLGQREPPRSARPGSNSGGQTDGRRSAPPLVRDGQRQADHDRSGASFHNIKNINHPLELDYLNYYPC